MQLGPAVRALPSMQPGPAVRALPSSKKERWLRVKSQEKVARRLPRTPYWPSPTQQCSHVDKNTPPYPTYDIPLCSKQCSRPSLFICSNLISTANSLQHNLISYTAPEGQSPLTTHPATHTAFVKQRKNSSRHGVTLALPRVQLHRHLSLEM